MSIVIIITILIIIIIIVVVVVKIIIIVVVVVVIYYPTHPPTPTALSTLKASLSVIPFLRLLPSQPTFGVFASTLGSSEIGYKLSSCSPFSL